MSSTYSPTPSRTSSPPATSTVPSSPPMEDELEILDKQSTIPIDQLSDEERLQRLYAVLEKSELYITLLAEQMNKAQLGTPQPAAKSSSKAKARTPSARSRSKGKPVNGSKRVLEDEHEDVDEPDSKRIKVERPEQPALLTGATLKDYQLEGVRWLIGLWENGVSGILADEMGLGKTIQTIAFIAYLRCRAEAPFLIISPLSVLHNWKDEFEKFAPAIPTCVYHGTPQERAALRQNVLQVKSLHKQNRKAKSERQKPTDDYTTQVSDFPVVLTTYEMIIKDRVHLSKYKWGYIVVDEGHRLKNMDSTLMREIKKYPSATRLILTGTPLQNNLSELWSLLNFILPDIFNDVSAFQDWFNLPTLSETLSSEKSSHIIHTLHAILKPFLLRRLKSDVEQSLPPKKEYVLYAPLSQRQREIYDAIVKGSLRGLLVGAKSDDGTQQTTDDPNAPRRLRNKKKWINYDVDGNDEAFFRRLERGEIKNLHERLQDAERAKSLGELATEHAFKTKMQKVNNMHLQNVVMQLRKVCSHPFLFDWPVDPSTMQPVVNDELVNSSGKMMVLERLLVELFARGHKVLLFSQFKTMLDVIEDWATEFKNWPVCRIDGSTSALDRRSEMRRFQNGADAPNAPRLFLLSTRAGSLGINLTAADTVIFYDQDWNPQVDLQAQDRAHRIGQTKPVLVYHILTKHTIEGKIMQRAGQKRQLEALVIAKGKFKMPLKENGKRETMVELAGSLLELEGEKIEVVPDTDAGRKSVLNDTTLNALLDRSPEVFRRRGAGWRESDLQATEGRGKKTRDGLDDVGAFEVYQAPVDQANEALAKMMCEDTEDNGI